MRPIKKAGFRQGILQISSTAKEMVGTLRITHDGRAFRYSKAGASALAAGKMGVGAAINADHLNETPAATAVGAKQVTVTVTAGTAIAENALRGGYLQVNDAAGEGHQYLIESNSAITDSETSVTVGLAEGIKVALTTASEVTLVHNPNYGVTESTTEESLPVGIAPVAVTALYYYWAQTGGMAIALMADTATQGSMMTLGATAGSLKAASATFDKDQPIVGIAMATGVIGEYKPVRLTLD